ncbi:MAG: hypothetical protein ABI598_04520 [Chloroflexota bacterium]
MTQPAWARPLLAAALIALVATTGLAARPGELAAASPSLKLVAQTTYEVLPAERKAAVSVQITATSLLRDSATRRYSIDRAFLAVYPTATNIKITGTAGKPTVSVSSRSDSGLVLQLKFGSPLGSGKSLALTLTFDIEDPGGAPDRSLRISPSLVALPIWAYGGPGVPGSGVRVLMPADYATTIGRGPLDGPTIEPDGRSAYTSGALASPADFVADLQADRPGDLTDDRTSVRIADSTVTLRIRSWPDDPDWNARVTDILTRGLPALASAIGLPWRSNAELEVRETLVRSGGAASGLAGSAGAATFDPATNQLSIPFTADASAILHGAAHAWFNADIVADRWIADGFAALYAGRAAVAIGEDIAMPTIDPAARPVPLNAWVAGGPDDGYGRAAALQLARSIAEQTGDTALAEVWGDAAAGISAYRASGDAGEPGDGGAASPARAGPVDWRSLLDLLEARTGGSYEGLWRARVIRATDGGLMDARLAARALYDRTVAAAAPWVLPTRIRDEMTAWQFEAASADLDKASDVIVLRTDIGQAVAAAGLTAPDALRSRFEGGDGVDAASAEALTELAVIGAYQAIVEARPLDPGPVTAIGLLGADPEADIEAARMAFAAGDLDATISHAEQARAIWSSAPETGQSRVASVTATAIAVLLLGWMIVARLRQWRRRRTGKR